ncbi:MAG: MBL fold metallo-hydrolase [Mesorhizobium sp.]|nr:MBL fold metallo-hydrolase [Mesorhizobium sp.]
MQITRRTGLKLMVAGAAASAFPAISAEAKSPTAQSKSTRLILLGTGGGPTPLPVRNQPANVLLVNDEPYIVDAGNGVARQLMLAGIAAHRVGRIFITHHHDDHNADMGTLMGLAWSNGRASPSEAYGPPGTEAMVEAFVLNHFVPGFDPEETPEGWTAGVSRHFSGRVIVGENLMEV